MASLEWVVPAVASLLQIGTCAGFVAGAALTQFLGGMLLHQVGSWTFIALSGILVILTAVGIVGGVLGVPLVAWITPFAVSGLVGLVALAGGFRLGWILATMNLSKGSSPRDTTFLALGMVTMAFLGFFGALAWKPAGASLVAGFWIMLAIAVWRVSISGRVWHGLGIAAAGLLDTGSALSDDWRTTVSAGLGTALMVATLVSLERRASDHRWASPGRTVR